MKKSELRGKVLAYTSAIMADVQSDFSMAKSLKVPKYSANAKRNVIKKAIRKDPKKIAKLLRADGGKELQKSLGLNSKAQLAIIEELTSMKKLLAVTASNGVESVERSNFRDKVSNKKEERSDNKRLDKLLHLLEKGEKEEPEDEEVCQVINNYYNESGGSGGMFGGGKDKKKGRQKGGRGNKTKLGAVGKGAGIAGALMVVSDYVIGDKEMNNENLTKDGGMIAGAGAGGLAGASIGAVGGPVGSAIGGVIGGVLGGIGGSKIGKEVYNYFNKDKKESLKEVTDKITDKVSLNVLSQKSDNLGSGFVGESYTIDEHGRPVKYNPISEGFNPLDPDSYQHLNLDSIEGVTSTNDDGHGRKAFGGIDKEFSPELYKKAMRGEITGHEGNKLAMMREYQTTLKKMPELLEMSQLTQEFAGILAMNKGGTGATRFKPLYEMIEGEDYEGAIAYIDESKKLTQNHKNHLIGALEEAKNGYILGSSSKVALEVKKESKSQNLTPVEVPEKKELATESVNKLDKAVEKLAKVADNFSKNFDKGAPKFKSVLDRPARNAGELPQHLESVNDNNLIALSNEE